MILKLGLIAFFNFSIAFLTDEEVDIVLSNLKHLKIRKCIYSFETELNVTYIKKLNFNRIITGHATPEALEVYMTEMTPESGIAIVMKNKSYVENLFLKKYESLHWFIWFLLSDDEMNDAEIPINCQFFQIKKGKNGSYSVIDSFKIDDIFIGEDFGLWSPEKGLTAGSPSLYERRKDFRGIKLNVQLCKKYKVSMSVLEFYEDVGRTLNYTVVKETNILNKDIVSANYSGKDKDFDTCVWAITGAEKENDWVFLYCGIKIGVATKFRGTNEIGWRAYLTPFATDMWLAIILWLLISAVALLIVKGCRTCNIHLSIFTAFFCLCNSDPMVTHTPAESLSLSTKLVYLMVLTVPSVIIPAYSGYILSTLSCVLPLIPFVDLTSFIATGSFILTAPDNSFGLRFLRESHDPELRFIYENSFKSASRSYEEQFEKLCQNGQLAGIFPKSKELHDLFQCRMYVMPGGVTTISTGILLPSRSPLRQYFNRKFRKHSEMGLKYTDFRTPISVTKRFEEETENLNSLDMSQMKAIFLLVVFGVALSLIILLVEIAIGKRIKRNLLSEKKSVF